MSFIITILIWLVAILAGGIFALIIYARWNYGVLEGLGIPVVKPFLFFGSNYMDPYVIIAEESVARLKKFGMVYGVYEGRTPQIHISDPKLIRLITTTDSESFRNHGWDIGGDSCSIFGNMLDFLKDEKWKTVRGALTPVFTTGKIKKLGEIVKTFSDEYVAHLETHYKGEQLTKFEVREYLAPLLIEILAKCFCGIEIQNARDPNNVFVNQLKLVLMHDLPRDDWKCNITKIFPILLKILPSFEAKGMDFFISALRNSLEVTENSASESIVAANTLAEMMKHVREDPTYKTLGIDQYTVLAQGWEFFAASYVPILDVLVPFFYELAINPEVQDRVYAEILDSGAEEKGTPYLMACFKETLRLFVTFERLVERVCNRTWTHEGLRIPKGMQIMVPTSAVHRNPELYPDPDEFNPERFLGREKEERDPFAFVGFGHGPRNCIGQRFAMELLRIVTSSFLKKFKIERREDTKFEPYPGGVFPFVSIKPVYVQLSSRN